MRKMIIDRNLQCRYYLIEGDCIGNFSVEWANLKNIHLVLYYHTKDKYFVVWNSSIRNSQNSSALKANFSFGQEVLKRLNVKGFSDIQCCNKKIKYNNSLAFYEKVVLIPEKKLLDFCENYENYIYPTLEDLKERKYLVALPNGEVMELDDGEQSYNTVLREREQILRTRRDPSFRSKILEKYNFTCIVCGCKEEVILEAAHIKGVAEGGDDSPGNGFCLCRNHHRLYDAGMLTVDFDNNKFLCNSEAEKNMEWYKVAKKENFKLHIK